MLGLNKNQVLLASYQPDWNEAFLKEKKFLQQVLGPVALSIEHVGSTSVLNLSAKPIIDIAVGVKDIRALQSVIPVLTKAGYDVLDSIQTEMEVLARKGAPDCRTHYIHVEILNGDRWQSHILFRDYLKKHLQAVKDYEQLKQSLAKRYPNDRKKYTAAKSAFIQEIIKQALLGDK